MAIKWSVPVSLLVLSDFESGEKVTILRWVGCHGIFRGERGRSLRNEWRPRSRWRKANQKVIPRRSHSLMKFFQRWWKQFSIYDHSRTQVGNSSLTRVQPKLVTSMNWPKKESMCDTLNFRDIYGRLVLRKNEFVRISFRSFREISEKRGKKVTEGFIPWNFSSE